MYLVFAIMAGLVGGLSMMMRAELMVSRPGIRGQWVADPHTYTVFVTARRGADRSSS